MPNGRQVLARSYPIAIDAKGLNELAASDEAAERAEAVRHDLGDPRVMFLGVDRLDYTKGIVERIQAFGELIAEGRIDPDEAVLLQLAIPSRERVDLYRQLRDDIDMLVGRITAEGQRIGRPPIIYLHTSYPRVEIAGISSSGRCHGRHTLRDGMNLVAKEYVACRQRDDGALVLSEFTGAARNCARRTLVNPHDINGSGDRLEEAMNDSLAQQGPPDEGDAPPGVRNDIDRWATTFLEDLESLNGKPSTQAVRLNSSAPGYDIRPHVTSVAAMASHGRQASRAGRSARGWHPRRLRGAATRADQSVLPDLGVLGGCRGHRAEHLAQVAPSPRLG
jgi:trehalose 6-phosphate synthase